MTPTTYQLIDVLCADAAALKTFEDAVSSSVYAMVPGFSMPVPTEHIPLVPRLISERWNQELENLSCASLNNYRVLAELEEEEWPDPGWSLVEESPLALHCIRFTYQTDTRGAPTEYILEVSRRFPELRFGLCWLCVDGYTDEIAKKEICNGEILAEENYVIDDDPALFMHIASKWLGASFPDEDLED